MNILYDHQAFTVQDVGGVSRYYRALLDHATPDQHAEVSLRFSNNLYLQDRRYTRHRSFFPGQKFRGRFWLMWHLNQQAALQALRRRQFDVFHPTLNDNDYFLDALTDQPLVITIHDMIATLFPDQVPYQSALERIAARATHIITVSEHTRADVLRLLPVDPDRVTTIHHGFSPLAASSTGVEAGYILFVGTRRGYKNFGCVLQALQQLRKRPATAGLRLVCAGGGPPTPPELAALAELDLTNAVQFVSTVPDGVLAGLYRGAAAFVFPSHYEGFGIPILEAFGQRCPVVLSRASCFPEIAQDAALYFNPHQPEELTEQLGQLLRDTSLRRHLTEMGTLRLRDFTWANTAAATRQVYLTSREQPVFA